MTHVTTPSEHMALLDIHYDAVQPTRVSGSIAADERHHQPWGIVSGGQYTTAIEAFATFGAYEAVKDRGQQAVGVTNITDFVRPPGAHPAALAGRDPPTGGRQARRPRPGAPPQHRPMNAPAGLRR